MKQAAESQALQHCPILLFSYYLLVSPCAPPYVVVEVEMNEEAMGA